MIIMIVTIDMIVMIAMTVMIAMMVMIVIILTIFNLMTMTVKVHIAMTTIMVCMYKSMKSSFCYCHES